VNGADERALRAELAELRARLAERDRTVVVLGEQNTALREDNAALRAELTRLAEQFAELQRRLGQNPRNSDRPPSSEGYEKPAPKPRRGRSGRRPGGQPGHGGATLCQVASPDHVVVHSPRRCRCGRSLRHALVRSVERRQLFDLPEVRLAVTEHRLEHRVCRCGQVTMAEAPAGLGAPAQYGPGVKAVATYLLAGQHLPVARTAEALEELLAAPVSAGSLAAWYSQAAEGLDGFCDAVRAGLAAAPVLGADETGARIEGATNWLHVARTDSLTLLTAHDRRGVAAMTDADVLPQLAPDAVVVHDCWAPYWTFPVTHALCGAHWSASSPPPPTCPGRPAGRTPSPACSASSTTRCGNAGRPAPPRCRPVSWGATGAATTSSSPPAGPPTAPTIPESGGADDDPSTSTCSTGWTVTGTRCCGSPPTSGCRLPTTARSRTSARSRSG
jgi:uncharacterized coiled-coil protein SlyX